MKQFLKSSFSNPLAPFILIFALIILTTLIVSNIKTSMETAAEKETEFTANHTLLLDPQPAGIPVEPKQADLSKPDVPFLTASALADWSKGNFEAAEDKFRTILVFSPNNPVALSHLGALLHHRGDYKNAELMFRRQTLFFPSDPNAHMNLGTVLAKQNKFNEAIQVSKRSLELDPSNAASALSLAKIHSLANNKQTAMDYFKRAANILGPGIVEASWDPALDNIRNMAEFKEIIRTAGENK